MREVILPSGAVLKIGAAPFVDAKELYQAVLREVRGVEGTTYTDIFKELVCIGFSSPLIEKCLLKCLERCTYNAASGEGAGVDLKITTDTFEPVERRDDYMKVCAEVVKENVLPFGKSLYAEFQNYRSMLANIPQ